MDSPELTVEHTVMEKRANHMVRSFYSHGGHLILTNRRLVFKPHPVNIRAREVSIELADIVDIGKTEAVLGLSKQIWVRSKKGPIERFVVWRRAELLDAIKRQIIPRSNTWSQSL